MWYHSSHWKWALPWRCTSCSNRNSYFAIRIQFSNTMGHGGLSPQIQLLEHLTACCSGVRERQPVPLRLSYQNKENLVTFIWQWNYQKFPVTTENCVSHRSCRGSGFQTSLLVCSNGIGGNSIMLGTVLSNEDALFVPCTWTKKRNVGGRLRAFCLWLTGLPHWCQGQGKAET